MAQHVILITGASSGFGYGAALALAERGHRVFAALREADGRNAETAQALREAADGFALEIVELDVTSTASVDQAVGQVAEAAGRLDAVVNNAGQMFVGITEAFTPEQFQAQLDVNLVGPFRVSRAALPHMRRQRSGLLLHVSTVAARFAGPFFALYHASKHGLEALAESLRYELAPYGIDSCLIEPGPFSTNLFPSSPRPEDAEREAENEALHPLMEQVLAGFGPMFEDPDLPTDPAFVVEAIVDLIERPAGERPLRTIVGLDLGVVGRYNEATAPFAAEVLGAFGIGHLESVRSATNAAPNL